MRAKGGVPYATTEWVLAMFPSCSQKDGVRLEMTSWCGQLLEVKAVAGSKSASMGGDGRGVGVKSLGSCSSPGGFAKVARGPSGSRVTTRSMKEQKW